MMHWLQNPKNHWQTNCQCTHKKDEASSEAEDSGEETDMEDYAENEWDELNDKDGVAESLVPYVDGTNCQKKFAQKFGMAKKAWE